MENNAVALAAIGLVGTILALVVKPLFNLLKAQTEATSKNTKALNKIAEETAKGNREAKQRNGHLAELVLESQKSVMMAVQNVHEQKVEHQTVRKKD